MECPCLLKASIWHDPEEDFEMPSYAQTTLHAPLIRLSRSGIIDGEGHSLETTVLLTACHGRLFHPTIAM